MSLSSHTKTQLSICNPPLSLTSAIYHLFRRIIVYSRWFHSKKEGNQLRRGPFPTQETTISRWNRSRLRHNACLSQWCLRNSNWRVPLTIRSLFKQLQSPLLFLLSNHRPRLGHAGNLGCSPQLNQQVFTFKRFNKLTRKSPKWPSSETNLRRQWILSSIEMVFRGSRTWV